MLLGALLPVNQPSLRHLILDECGFGGRELGLLAGMFNVAPWLVFALQGALNHILDESILGSAVQGSWSQPLDDAVWGGRPVPWASFGDDAFGSACTALEGLLRTWLTMDPAAAAAEVKRLMLPPCAAAAATAAFASPYCLAARKAALTYAPTGPSRLVGLVCLLVHPVIQPVMEALRQLWEAVQGNKASVSATAVGVNATNTGVGLPSPHVDGWSKSLVHSPEAKAAFQSMDAAFVHLRSCAEVPGLSSLSLGRNNLAHESGGPLGAAVSLSNGLWHLSLHGIVQPPPPAPITAAGAAAAVAAAVAAQGGPLAAAAAAARDARELVRLLYPAALLPPLPNPFASFRPSQMSAHRVTMSTSELREGPTLDGPLLSMERPSTAVSSAVMPDSAVAQPHLNGALQAYQAFMPGLRSLDLTDAGISSYNAGHLADLVRQMPFLEQITLDFNSLTSTTGCGGTHDGSSGGGGNGNGSGGAAAAGSQDGTATLFADLAALPSLSYVSLNYACDAGAMFAVADYLLGLSSIHPTSTTSSTSPSGGQAGNLACPNLRVLSLVGCPLDVAVARRIARGLMHHSSLAVLRLGGGDPPEGVGPVGSRALAEAFLSQRSLVELSLSGVGLTDNAAKVRDV